MAAYVVRSVTVAEVMDDDGEISLTIDTTGDPTEWQQLGMLDFALTATRLVVAWPDDDD
jgi:hypothetical protein